MKTINLATVGLLILSTLILGGWSDCGPSLNQDPSFDLWCGDKLCAWETEAGTVAKVSTWHRDDAGVELVGDPAAISQHLDITSVLEDCLRIEFLADIDPEASVNLELDFMDDGSIELALPASGQAWAPVSFTLTPPTWFLGARVGLRKTGSGHARLAHLRITSADDCSTPPIDMTDRPAGAACERDAHCRIGHCEEAVWPFADLLYAGHRACGGCSATADCAAEEVCGVEADLEGGIHRDCGPAGRHLLGERCLEDAECATGVCCGTVCSACCVAEHACPRGLACQFDPLKPPQEGDWPVLQCESFSDQCPDNYLNWVFVPWRCAPNGRQGQSGELCLTDADCQSGRCLATGQLRTCMVDGARCDQDGACPIPWQLSGSSGVCLAIGALDGRCD